MAKIAQHTYEFETICDKFETSYFIFKGAKGLKLSNAYIRIYMIIVVKIGY